MRFNIIKKLFSVVLGTWFTFSCISLTEISAKFEDIELQGGSYEDVLNEKRIYQEQKPDDKTVYECHHLIAKEALNLWGDYITKGGKLKSNIFNEFLIDDLEQKWAPAIIMEKTDHEQTLSYFNLYTRTQKQNEKASEYIDSQAMRIIFYGDIIGVLKEETDFIYKTFGHKYDKALSQVWDYIKSLRFRQPNCHELTMINPYDERWYFSYKF